MSKAQNPHIIYIITQLELGGAQKICLNLMKGLLAQGTDVSLISGAEGPLIEQTTQFTSVYLLTSLKNELNIKNLKNDLETFFHIVRIIKKLKKQNPQIIVHTHSTKAGIFGRWAAFFSGIKNRIHTVHGFGFNKYQSKLRWLMIYILELITVCVTTKFVCVSQKDIDEGTRLFPNFKKKSTLIRAAVDYQTFYLPAKKTSLEKKNNNLTIGTISCFKPQKNLFDLLKAFELAVTATPPKLLRLQIIGDGTQRAELEQWIFEHNLIDQIELLGWQNNVKPWLEQWDIFTLSSLWEGLAIGNNSAMLSYILRQNQHYFTN
jgi:glycosyltransferase involved in cell wall biosynthesis